MRWRGPNCLARLCDAAVIWSIWLYDHVSLPVGHLQASITYDCMRRRIAWLAVEPATGSPRGAATGTRHHAAHV
jgi:hypothetical protein